MDFYSAKYKTEKFFFGKWREENLGKGQLVVIAESLEDATVKVNSCLQKASHEKERKVLNSDIQRCDGLFHFDTDGSGLSHFWAIS